MLNVDSCLCLTLETGGLVIGWLYFVIYILLIILLAIFLILICFVNCIDLQEVFGRQGVDMCHGFHGLIIGVLVVVILILVGLTFISFRCTQGAKTRNAAKVRPMMIWLAISTVLSLLQISALSAGGIVSGLAQAALSAYFFVVLYSLYERFRQEAEGGGNRHNLHYQVAGKV